MLDINAIYICNRNWRRHNAADYRITTDIIGNKQHNNFTGQRSIQQMTMCNTV